MTTIKIKDVFLTDTKCMTEKSQFDTFYYKFRIEKSRWIAAVRHAISKQYNKNSVGIQTKPCNYTDEDILKRSYVKPYEILDTKTKDNVASEFIQVTVKSKNIPIINSTGKPLQIGSICDLYIDIFEYKEYICTCALFDKNFPVIVKTLPNIKVRFFNKKV